MRQIILFITLMVTALTAVAQNHPLPSHCEWHRVGATGEPAYANGVEQHLKNGLRFYYQPSCCDSCPGEITITGEVTFTGINTYGQGATLFILPAPFRPGVNWSFPVVYDAASAVNAAAWLDINQWGAVIIQRPGGVMPGDRVRIYARFILGN